MNGPHLSDIALIVLAARRAPHPHIEACAYCREQYEALIAMEDLDEAHSNAPRQDTDDSVSQRPFRLAAQSNVDMDTEIILRQTWYLDEGRVLLRVFEERSHLLIGYVICAPERLSTLRIRFGGLESVFTPGSDGSFLIGSADIPIEPMQVTIE